MDSTGCCRGSAYWNGPAAVVVTYRDGRRAAVTFDSRLDACVKAEGDADVAGIGAARRVDIPVPRAISWN